MSLETEKVSLNFNDVSNDIVLESCLLYIYLHKISYQYYNSKCKYYIFSIVSLSFIVGIINIITPLFTIFGNIVFYVLSIFCGILTFLFNYFKYLDKTQLHKKAMFNWYSLYNKHITHSININEYNTLLQESPPIEHSTLVKLKNKILNKQNSSKSYISFLL